MTSANSLCPSTIKFPGQSPFSQQNGIDRMQTAIFTMKHFPYRQRILEAVYMLLLTCSHTETPEFTELIIPVLVNGTDVITLITHVENLMVPKVTGMQRATGSLPMDARRTYLGSGTVTRSQRPILSTMKRVVRR